MSKEMVMTKVEDRSATGRVKKGILGVIINAVLMVFSLTCIFPLIWMLYSSLKENLPLFDLFRPPQRLHRCWCHFGAIALSGCTRFFRFANTCIALQSARQIESFFLEGHCP